MPIRELLAQLLTEVRSAWRFRWYGAAAAWALALAGWAWAIWQPNIYEATARVYVDTSSALRPILNNRIVAPDIATQLAYVRQALLGREHLERVIRENDLDSAVRSEGQRQRLFDKLGRDIVISISSAGAASSNANANSVYTLTYQHTDRDKAVGVVRTLLSSLVETTLGGKQERTDTAERFLEDRIREYENRLQQAETTLADFKKRNADRLPGTQGGYFERIRTESEALEAIRKDLRLAEIRRDRLVEQLDSEAPVVPSGSVQAEPPPNSLDARIAQYRAQLDQLLLEYTERHPDVINTRETLARLEQQRADQLAALGVEMTTDAPLSALDSNPIYQTLRIALNEAEVEIDALQEDVRDRSAKLAELQGLVDEVPEVEAELTRLNRDYDVVYEQYQALVRSRETQELSRKASDSDDVEFRVIDPPLANLEPVAPNRLLLLVAVFAAALGAGGAVCWLLAQLKPVFSNIATLRAVSGLPVIGAVSLAFEEQHLLRRRMALIGFAGTMSCLAVLFAVVVAFEVLGPGLHFLVEGL